MARKTRMNDLTSPELLAQVNPENMRLLDDFVNYLRSVQRSEQTIYVYKNDLEIAWVWALQHNNNKFFINWTKRDIVAFQNWMINENGNSPARVRRLKATLSSLSNMIEAVMDDEYPKFRNIIHKIESPVNQPTREKTVLSDEQIDKLLDTLTERGQYDKACLVALALCSGRRKAELTLFKVGYFDDKNLICDGALYKTSEKIRTKGRGTTGKQIYVYTLAKKFRPYFERWMNYRNDNGIESEWLFPLRGDPSQHIRADTLNSWAESFGKILGVDFYMHSMRHLWTTRLARAGLPETVIKELAQWSSLDMVSIYNDLEAEEMFSDYFKDGDISVSNKKTLGDM